ncbi:MAG: carbonic anhydrase [Polyangiales bacterium]
MHTKSEGRASGPSSRRRRAWILVAAGILAVIALINLSPRAEFVLGGALVNLGYRLQDPLDQFDFSHGHDVRPTEIWDEALRQNPLAASVRARFPRASHHPVIAVVVCMDARIDTNELMGDTRRYYYVIRTAGSVIGEHEEEMLELAVENGVRVVLFTTHTECAAERVAATPASRVRYPALAAAVDERERRIAAFLARPTIAARVRAGTLVIRRAEIDTRSGALRTH